MANDGSRMLHLEGARGIASVLVIFHHFMLAFRPEFEHSFRSGGLRLTPVFPLVNGNGAVAFFFLLSGFVLTFRFFGRPSADDLAASVIKRLPRLFVPAGVTILAGYLILGFAPHSWEAAADLSGSWWLDGFGHAGLSDDFRPSFDQAARDMLLVFLMPDHIHFNSNLWTMRGEFLGSLLVFGVSALVFVPNLRRPPAMLAVHAVLLVAAATIDPAFVPFLLGSGLAYVMAAGLWTPSFGRRATAALLVSALAAFMTDTTAAVIAGSLFAMLALLGSRPLAAAMSGGVGRVLGTVSFPIYLVHTLVILTISSALYVALQSRGLPEAAVLSIDLAATLAAVAVAAVPLVLLERWWVPFLNRRTRRLVAALRKAAPTPPVSA